MLFQSLILNLCLLFFTVSAYAADVNDVFPVHKGINVGAWLAPPQRQPLFLRDFAQIKQAGFDHVRIPVDPDMLVTNNAKFSILDNAISLAIDNNLAVIIDMHPTADFMQKLQSDIATQQAFQELWVALVKHYKNYPPAKLAFGLLNEPQYYGKERLYNEWVNALVKAIRSEDSGHFLIIDGPDGASVEGLKMLEPIHAPNVIYDFHFYEPYIITHQGYQKGFEGKMLRYFRNLPYPSQLADRDASYYAPDAPNLSQAENQLTDYTYGKWNAGHIDYLIHKAREWADNHHVHIICGEFGVLRNHIDNESRFRWIEDTRKVLDINNIGWEVWNYTDGFGITTLNGKTYADPKDGSVRLTDPMHGSRTLEPQALKALGMN